MVGALLQQFEPFSSLSAEHLHKAAAHARELVLPAERWLTRPGRRLAGSYYLLRGRVRTLQPDGEIGDADHRARHPIVPGAAAVKTLTAARLLVVDGSAALGEQLLGARWQGPEHLLPRPLPAGWEHRFLRHPVVRGLGPRRWQKLLRAMQPRWVDAGETIVQEGEAGAALYVVRSGIAGVWRHQLELARLGAGDFFGEDGIVLRAPRNATVRMSTAGCVMALPEHVFLGEMLLPALAGEGAGPDAAPLRLGSAGVLLEDLRAHARGLPDDRGYLVLGETPAQAILGAFLMIKTGHRVKVAEDALGGYLSELSACV